MAKKKIVLATIIVVKTKVVIGCLFEFYKTSLMSTIYL